MQGERFEPSVLAWKARVLPDYTIPAQDHRQGFEPASQGDNQILFRSILLERQGRI